MIDGVTVNGEVRTLVESWVRSLEAEGKSEESMHLHHRWAQSMALIQIAIAGLTFPAAAAADDLAWPPISREQRQIGRAHV